MKPETKLWKLIKSKTPLIRWNRIENAINSGIPDLLGSGETSSFFTVELKITYDNKTIRFSPHQISFHMKHNLNTFILVACDPDPELVRLYPGSQILELVDSGLKLVPLREGLKACCLELERL